MCHLLRLGQPTDDPAPVIVQAAKRLDEGHFPLSQVGIQFVQIGSDPAAAEALREMDDDLAAANGIRVSGHFTKQQTMLFPQGAS